MTIIRATLIFISSLVLITPVTAGDYNLVIANTSVSMDGKLQSAITVNGKRPGPLLNFTEGEDVAVTVRNDTPEVTSVHWHGLLVPGDMDGAPGFNGFAGIAPGSTFTYPFKVRQHGTWYHSHSGLHEQAGLYGPIVVAPPHQSAPRTERDYVVFLSDASRESAGSILNHLKTRSDYHNYHRRTVGDFFRDVSAFGLGKAITDRLEWDQMRMDPTDLSDVSGRPTLT